MKLQEIYDLAIRMGQEADPRGQAAAEKVVTRAQRAFAKLDEEEKPFFDPDSLTNPYADTRILVGQPEAEISRVLVGVDLETPELLLAEALANRGQRVDLLLAHHPEGRALVGLPEVMKLQTGALATVGVLPNLAESLLEGRCGEVAVSVGVGNYNRMPDAARLLGYNLICVHTPCDNLVTRFVTQLMEKEAPETVDDVCKLLRTIPEYAAAAKLGNGPNIVAGNAKRSAGKVYVDFTGGTSGPKEFLRLLSEAGVSTVLCMHLPKDAIELARENGVNVVIAGHMASDSLGLNLFLDQLEARGVEILPCSGLIRVRRDDSR